MTLDEIRNKEVNEMYNKQIKQLELLDKLLKLEFGSDEYFDTWNKLDKLIDDIERWLG